MASERELSRIRRDPVEWREIVSRLLKIADQDGIEDRHVVIVESLNAQTDRVELSYRQAEWLLDARDDSEFVSEFRSLSVSILLNDCYERIYRIEDEEDQKWLEERYRERAGRLRRKDAKTLYRLAATLGAIDTD